MIKMSVIPIISFIGITRYHVYKKKKEDGNNEVQK